MQIFKQTADISIDEEIKSIITVPRNTIDDINESIKTYERLLKEKELRLAQIKSKLEQDRTNNGQRETEYNVKRGLEMIIVAFKVAFAS